MKSRIAGLVGPLVGAVCLAAAPAASAATYVVLGKGAGSLDREIRAAGGQVRTAMPEIGVFIVESDATNFMNRAKRIAAVSGIAEDVMLEYDLPVSAGEAVSIEDYGNPPFSGDDDVFFDLQWGHDAVDAPEAWNAGYRGAGATVAILDGGYDLEHPDLVPNLGPGGTAWGCHANFSDDPSLAYSFPDPFSHGTHVAGTVAAADNAFGTIGVAPEATLCLVKVLGDVGSGAFSWLIEGIYHIANPEFGVDVANMSLGARFPRNSAGAAQLISALGRAAAYATQNGVLMITSGGNEGANLDKDQMIVNVPSQAANFVSISATGPIGWAVDPENAFLDYLANYSNYGVTGIEFAAPGGDYIYPGSESCLIAGLVRPCFVFDYVFSTGNGGWYWSVGTSMAAPHAAGVAALIVGKNGGSMKPAQVLKAMRAGADDLGKPGRDPAYSKGRVNAYGSVSN